MRLADGYLQDPVVSLTVVEINSLKCSVFGQVARSGSIKFTPGHDDHRSDRTERRLLSRSRARTWSRSRASARRQKRDVQDPGRDDRRGQAAELSDDAGRRGVRAANAPGKDVRPPRVGSSVIGIVAVAGAAIFLVGGAIRWAQAIVARPDRDSCSLPPDHVTARLRARSTVARRARAAAVITLFQLVPLPDRLLEYLQPVGIALREDGSALAGDLALARTHARRARDTARACYDAGDL